MFEQKLAGVSLFYGSRVAQSLAPLLPRSSRSESCSPPAAGIFLYSERHGSVMFEFTHCCFITTEKCNEHFDHREAAILLSSFELHVSSQCIISV